MPARTGAAMCIALLTIAASAVNTAAAKAAETANASSSAASPPLPSAPPAQTKGPAETEAAAKVSFRAMVVREAERQNLPPALADAVVHVESGYDPKVVGSVGEVGLMQVRPATAAMLGHGGSISDLFNPETNVRYGIAYLAGAWRLAGGDLCLALAKYRAGHGESHISPRSAAYCQRARAHLAAWGSPLGLGAPGNPATQLQWHPSARTAVSAQASRRASEIRRLWADHAARVRGIETRLARLMGS